MTKYVALRSDIEFAWQAQDRLQLGLGNRAVVLRGVQPGEDRLLQRLRAGVGSEQFRLLAREEGVREQRARRLLQVLEHAGLLAEAQSAAPAPGTAGHPARIAQRAAQRRRGSDILVDGVGPVAEAIRRDLTAAGAQCVTDGADPALVVVVGSGWLDPMTYVGLVRDDAPHLLVTTTAQETTIGPLIRPGQTACARCVELHEDECNGTRQRIRSQTQETTAATDPVLTALASAHAVAAILGFLDDPDTVPSMATALHVSLPGARLAITEYTPHPQCGCVMVPEHLTMVG